MGGVGGSSNEVHCVYIDSSAFIGRSLKHAVCEARSEEEFFRGCRPVDG